MSIAVAERLKQELTDRYVIVAKGVPELRRFVGLTGTVKTVNMNGRALVEFDGPEDIGWYDIDPSYLTVVDAPLPKEEPEEKKPAEKKEPAKAAPAAGGMSPLDRARAEGAGGGGDAPEKKLSPLEQARAEVRGAAEPAAEPAGDKPLSPLEQARLQGAGGNADDAASEPANEEPASKGDAEEEDLSKLSPIEQLRRQGSKLD